MMKFVVKLRCNISLVELVLDQEKIGREPFLVLLNSKYVEYKHIQNPPKSIMGKLFYKDFSFFRPTNVICTKYFIFSPHL